MQWTSFSEFISMGGYGVFVWGSYGVTFMLLVAEILMLRSRKRRLEQNAIAIQQLETRNSKLETVL